MTRARPSLGYPSRSAACRALRLEGLDNTQIIARFRAVGETITTEQISALLTYQTSRKAGRLNLGRAVIERLGPHAAQRGITSTELAERLLAVIASDQMVDAVLDDRPCNKIQEET